MKKLLKLTQAEQRSLLFLFLVFTVTTIWRYWPTPSHELSIEFLPAEYHSQLSSPDTVKTQFQHKSESIKPAWNLEKFDINYATAKQLRSMGFSNDFISVWFQQKNSTGFVTSINQFKQLNLLDDQDLNKVTPYLDFSRYEKAQSILIEKSEVVQVNVNQANALELQQLKGIGPVLSKRIVSYREKLGGFVTLNQLHEVYGLHDSVLLLLQDDMVLSTDIQSININSADAKTLYGHPYIDYKRAQSISRYRDQHGDFTRLEDLMQIVLIDTVWFNRIKPYLSL